MTGTGIRPKCRWQGNIEVDIQEMEWGCEIRWPGTGVGLLWTRRWTCGGYKMQRILWLAGQLLVSTDGICCMGFVIYTAYTGCHRRNGPNFGRVFLMLNYTDITQNTYTPSWTVTEIMAREKSGHLTFPRTVRLQLSSALTVREECGTHFFDGTSSAQRDKIAFHYCRYVQCLVTLRTTVTWVRVFCSSI